MVMPQPSHCSPGRLAVRTDADARGMWVDGMSPNRAMVSATMVAFRDSASDSAVARLAITRASARLASDGRLSPSESWNVCSSVCVASSSVLGSMCPSSAGAWATPAWTDTAARTRNGETSS